MGFFKTDKDAKAVKGEISKMIREGYPVYKDGKKLYGKDAEKAVRGLTLAGDSVFDVLLAILTDGRD